MKKSTVSVALAFTLLLSAPAVILQPLTTVMAADASGTTASLSNVLKNQQADGGWRKDYSETSGDGRVYNRQ